MELLDQLLEKGEKIMQSFNPSAVQNSKQVCGKTANLFAENQQTCERKTNKHTYNLKKKSKDNNLNQSILSDGIDMMDNSSKVNSSGERNKYLEIVKENIEYEYQTEKEKIDELVEIILDVICSQKDTVRVNTEDVPHEVVKSRFLKLNSDHIDYVLTAMGKNTSEIRSIRSYLITALYNAPATMDSYYTAWVNHDMYG